MRHDVSLHESECSTIHDIWERLEAADQQHAVDLLVHLAVKRMTQEGTLNHEKE